MTEEEIKKKAWEYAKEWNDKIQPPQLGLERAYITGARVAQSQLTEKDKQIEQREQEKCELLGIIQAKDKQIEGLHKELADYQFNYPTIKELEKENAELKEKVREQSERISELTQELDDIINKFG